MDLFETKLLADCRKGSHDAFGVLVKTYADQVYRMVLPVVNDSEDARDISQEVFLKVFRKLDSFRGQSSLRTWICSIALNSARDHLRKHKIREVPLEEDRLGAFSVQQDKTEQTEQQIVLYAALGKLDHTFQEIIILKEFSGFSYTEISEILDIEIGTVKSRLSRARNALREQLNEEGVFF